MSVLILKSLCRVSAWHKAPLILLALIMFFGKAQHLSAETAPERKKVAVVLSGGGTKGMAHIGVLRALEENNIPIDYIAGTSIGAIIGSMYAIGYAPDEIEELVLSREFEQASVGRIDDSYRQFYLEPDADPSWVRFYFGWEDRLEPQNIIRQNIPSNIVSPYLMDFLFMEHLGPASAAANYHFDNLYIPFRCIATEVESRSAVTMRDGSLPDAVRASMTFPFYFQPIEIDGKLMMDGGMFNNFPADVVHMEFQPDIVIGSVVSDNPPQPRRDNIISQLENLLMHPSNYDILTDQGVVIRPDVPDIAVNDMSRNAELIEIGYEATISKIDDVLYYVDALEDPVERYLKRMTFRNSIPEMIVGEIRISGLRQDQEDFVLQALGADRLPVKFDELKFNYFSMLLNNRFDYVYPFIEYDNLTGLFVLNLEMEKEREMLRAFGGNLSSRPINHLFAKFDYYRWSNRPLTLSSNMYFGNFYNNFGVSVRRDHPGQYPIYLKTSAFYSRWEYARSSIFLIEEQEPPFLSQNEFNYNILLGYPLGNNTKLEFGATYRSANNRFYNTRSFSDDDTMDHLRFSPLFFETTIERNTLNRKQYPTRGSHTFFSVVILQGTERYTPGSTASDLQSVRQQHTWIEALFRYKNFFMPNSRLNPGISGELFVSQRPLFQNLTSTMSMTRQYSPFPVSKTLFMPEFRANNYAATGIKTIYTISENASIQTEAHLFQPLRYIESSESEKPVYANYHFNPRLMANLAIVYHTAPGPLSISMSYFHNERESWVFMVNFGFLLFNNLGFM